MLRRGLLAFLLFAGSFGAWAQGVLPPPEPKPEPLTRILFVFDASNSMYGRWQTGTRMEVAQRLMRELLDSLGRVEKPHFELALRVYGHQKPVPPQDCNDTRLEVAFSPTSIPRIQKTLAGLRPMGTTPIARSLIKAGSDFRNARTAATSSSSSPTASKPATKTLARLPASCSSAGSSSNPLSLALASRPTSPKTSAASEPTTTQATSRPSARRSTSS